MLAEHERKKGLDGGIVYSMRWFTDNDFNLSVYHDPIGKAYMFELIWDLPSSPRCIRWINGKGVNIYKVDAGEDSPLANRTPVLEKHAEADLEKMVANFKRSASKIDPEVRKLVEEQMAVYGHPGPAFLSSICNNSVD